MALFFSLNHLENAPCTGEGLEISVYLLSHRAPAKMLSLRELSASLRGLIDGGLQGIDPTVLEHFLGVDLGAE